MNILAVESSAGPASVCVLSGGKILYEANANVGLTHSQTIMPMVGEAVKMSGLAVGDFDFLAVACGPGSFTGVRIGVSAVKGMALGSGKKCVGVSTLEAMAYNMICRDSTVCCVMDARCRQVYCGLFKSENGVITRISEDAAVSIDDLRETLRNIEGDVFLVGDGAEICFNVFGSEFKNVRLAPAALRFQRASSVALCAENMLKNGFNAVEGDKLDVVYLRLPQAERELRKRNGEEK